MPVLLQIALGGALGAVLRHGTVALFQRLIGPGVPWGTLAVNVTGCFAMGVLAALVATRGDLGLDRAAPFLMPGLLGGFTTFSAFSLETHALAERGGALDAVVYAGGSVALCLAAVAGGVWLARGWAAP